MSSLLAFPAGPRAKWVVFFTWLLIVIGTVATGLPEKFTDAEKNESTSFLPGDAESTKALEITEELNDGEKAPTVIVYRRDGGLTDADKQAIQEDLSKLNEITAEYPNTSEFGNPEGPRATAPFQLSEDGTTALIGNQITGTGESSEIIDPVEDYREAVSRDEDGLVVKVTGPAGVSADAIKVFENINGTLVAAALGLVIFLLIIIYRSPVFWFFPILAVVFAEIAARAFGYGLTEIGVTVNGQSSSILSVLVIGAGTDYALLLVARYREELHQHQDKHEAMAIALRRAGPAILASGATVAAALLSLALAKVNGTAGLGPIGAMGVVIAVISMLTFLPAVLVIVGRRRFWPFVPYGPEGSDAPDHTPMRVPGLSWVTDRVGPAVTTFLIIGLLATVPALLIPGIVIVAVLGLFFRFVGPTLDRKVFTPIEHRFSSDREGADETHGGWRRVAERVAKHPVRVAVASTAVLLIFCLGLLNFDDGLTQGNSFRGEVESIAGQEVIAQAFPSGQSAPTDIVVPEGTDIPAVVEAAAGIEGVAAVPPEPVNQGGGYVQLAAFLQLDPYSTEAFEVIPQLREAVQGVTPEGLVGGSTAVEADLRSASSDDNLLLMPLALVIVFVILLVLLRAVVAPVLLIATVVLSFFAALGVGAVVFDVVFGFPGSDPGLPLFCFIFLVALGVDYNIFLMTRAREETITYGTRRGMIRAVAVTGGVITAAGIVLAGTFSVLAVLPLVFLTQIGFVVAFGVLLDTFLVRSVLVPSLVEIIGPKIWWPSALAREEGREEEQIDEPAPAAAPGQPAPESA
ncbi:MMPL family transporter [Svornostia abyssi]|uniref:MMPL family transporter n=1 Tax=Svornostia abyssi TaxID=2898438 RepID=A0ABY5PB53_9ACTN|nr:MMPL family transporter [Parviterribacteraceae bacterium J379]